MELTRIARKILSPLLKRGRRRNHQGRPLTAPRNDGNSENPDGGASAADFSSALRAPLPPLFPVADLGLCEPAPGLAQLPHRERRRCFPLPILPITDCRCRNWARRGTLHP